MAKMAREAAAAAHGVKRKRVSFGGGILAPGPEGAPKPKRARTTDDIPFAPEYRHAPPSPTARSELPERSRPSSSSSAPKQPTAADASSAVEGDIPQMTVFPHRRRECKKPARYSDFETDDEQHSRITSPTRNAAASASPRESSSAGATAVDSPPAPAVVKKKPEAPKAKPKPAAAVDNFFRDEPVPGSAAAELKKRKLSAPLASGSHPLEVRPNLLLVACLQCS